MVAVWKQQQQQTATNVLVIGFFFLGICFLVYTQSLSLEEQLEQQMASANALDVLPVGESFQKPKLKQKPTSSNRCNESSEWTSPKEDQSTVQSPTTSPTAANMGRMKSSPQPLVNDKTKSHKKSSTTSQESKKQKSNEHPTTPTTTTTGTKNNSSNVSSNQQQQVQIQPSSPSGAGGVSLNETTTARRSSAGGGRNNGSTKTCCFCWCCCYRCTWCVFYFFFK